MQAGRGRIMQKIRSQAADEQSSLPSRQPRSQATRQIGTCRQPGQQPTNKETRSEQARQQTSEPASMPTKQPGHHPASQPTKQATSQTRAKTIKRERQRGTQKQQHTHTHSQAGALLAQLLRDSPSLPERDSIAKELGSECKPCLTETKHDQKQ